MSTASYDLSNEDLFVLHINTAKTWRGGERQVFFLAAEIQAHGGRQIVVGQPGSELERRCREAGLPFNGVRMRGEWDWRAARAIAELVRESGANLLHAHTAKAHTIALWARRKVRGAVAPALVVSRRVDFPARLNFLSRRKYLSPLVDRYIAISENVKKILIQDGIAPDRIDIAFSGIDLTPFASLPDASGLRAEFAVQKGEIVLGNVAALVDHKDQLTLLAGLAACLRDLPADAPPVRLFILGEGRLRKDLEARAVELGIAGRVVFTGFREDVSAFLSLFDVFVMSSKEEGLGTAVLDAMAAGLPVVSTRGGGLPEMVDHERGGLLADVGDAEGLGRALGVMVRDADARHRFGAYNKERVQDFSRETTFRSTVDVYRKVLGR